MMVCMPRTWRVGSSTEIEEGSSVGMPPAPAAFSSCLTEPSRNAICCFMCSSINAIATLLSTVKAVVASRLERTHVSITGRGSLLPTLEGGL